MNKNQRYRPPVTIDDNDIRSIVDDIYDVLNDLSDSVNKLGSGAESNTSIGGGDMRVIKDGADGKSYIEFSDGDKILRVEGTEKQRKVEHF